MMNTIKSVEKALQLLNTIAAHGDWIGVRELARLAGLKAPNAQNILKTLQKTGYLEFDEQTRRYRLGLTVLRLAEGLDPVRQVGDFARPYVDELSEAYDETVAVFILLQRQMVVADWRGGRQALVVHEPRRIIEQPHVLAGGRVLLAWQDESFRRYYAEHVFEANLGINIPATPAELETEFARTRRQGYGEAVNTRESGIWAMSAPVFDATGRIVLALAFSAPLTRLEATRRDEALAKLLAVTARMTAALGGRVPESSPESRG